MIGFRILLPLLGLLVGSAVGVSYNCEQPDVKEVKGTCVLEGVTLLSPGDISNASFPDDIANGPVKLIKGNVTNFSPSLARKLSAVTDVTVDGMGIRELVVWPTWKHLSAQNNSITTVTFAGADLLGGLTDVDHCQLLTLHLQNNALKRVPSFGRRLKHLKVLLLDDNLLESVSMNSFANLGQLQTLSIARNRLIQVTTGAESLSSVQLVKLMHLSLASNRLLELHVTGWQMESLETLDLSGNDLYQMDVPNLGHFRALKEVRYAGNDWNCEWLSAMQLHLVENKISVTDAEASGRCEREKLMTLRGMCCYEPASKDFSLDLFGDRWEQLYELQRRYDLVKFGYDKAEAADMNSIVERTHSFRANLSEPASGQEAIEAGLRRLRSALDIETARMEDLTTRIDRSVTEVRQLIEDIYQRATQPKPTFNAVVQESLTDSIARIERNIVPLHNSIREYVSEIIAYDRKILQLDKQIASIDKSLLEQASDYRQLSERVKHIERDVAVAYNLVEEKTNDLTSLSDLVETGFNELKWE